MRSSDVRISSSTSIPSSQVSPALSARLSCGTAPIPMITSWAGNRVPSASSKAFTEPDSPSIRATAFSNRKCMPAFSSRCVTCAATETDATRARTRAPASTTVTGLLRVVNAEATSRPITPAPTTTASADKLSRIARRSAAASSRLRK